MSHELKYRHRVTGVGTVDTEPLWFCTCGGWTLRVRPMTHRSTGNNKLEAQTEHALHAYAHDLLTAGAAASYDEALEYARRFRD